MLRRAALALLLTGCFLDRSGNQAVGETTATTATGAGGMATGGGGELFGGAGGIEGASGGGGAGGAVGGQGGAGGGSPLETLGDDGLVVRYFLDEAARGVGPATAHDLAPLPLDLALDYAGNMAYAELQSKQRGLRWTTAAAGGRAWAVSLAGSKIEDRLGGSKTATIELVVDVEDAEVDSHLVAITANTCSTFCDNLALMTDGPGDLRLFVNDQQVASWLAPWPERERLVLHLVLDSTKNDANARARLYLDGLLQVVLPGATPIPKHETITMPTDGYFVLGNREPATKSIVGFIGYAALYDLEMAPTQITTHSARLLLSDDATP